MPEETLYISPELQKRLSTAQKPAGMDEKEFAEHLISLGLEKLARENARRKPLGNKKPGR